MPPLFAIILNESGGDSSSLCFAFHLHCMTYFWKLSLLLLLLTKPEFVEAQSFSVNGYVEDSVSGERIPRVNLYLVAERAGQARTILDIST